MQVQNFGNTSHLTSDELERLLYIQGHDSYSIIQRVIDSNDAAYLEGWNDCWRKRGEEYVGN